MAYTLKTTGLAAIATSVIAVDEDGTTIRDFVSASRTSAMTIDPAVVRGESTWKGSARSYFETLDNGRWDFKGIRIAAGQEILLDGSDGKLGYSIFVACAGGVGPSGILRGILSTDSDGALIINSTGKFTLNTGSGKVSTTSVPIDATKFSIGANFLRGVEESYWYGLESGSLAQDASFSEAGFGSLRKIDQIGGWYGQGSGPGKRHVVATFPRPLTLTEYQSLHDDWFGVLFDAGGTPVNDPPTFTGPNIGPQSGTVGTALSALDVSGRFSDTDALTFSAIGSWPAGVTVSSAGIISGTPTSAGTYAGLNVRATDTASQSVDSDSLTFTIAAAPPVGAVITTQPLKNNTGTLLASATIPKIAALKLSDMTLAAAWTNKTTEATGELILADAALIAGADYLVVTSSSDGTAAGVLCYKAAE